MAKISLRVYNREIESMIEGGQLDEAVAHCQHILKTFSMHIETYRLLGKIFLEAHRYADGADIFQRVLSAVPDDFVAHVGMSIIRDDEGKLDEAIWHMERAFEVQPSNPAIQGELRRLYGRRDGVEPPKIRLSRDALANMYAQGELFNQAIAEIRSVLADDPNRPDLQSMLARAYFQVGQKVEAAEIAAQLLKKYPYCLDALCILVEVLPGTGRAENTQVYRQRLRLLDPYTSFVTGSVFTSDKVTDSAVNLERLEYQPGKQPAASQPSWAASLGVKLDEEKSPDAQPAWLADGQSAPPSGTGPDTGSVPQGEPIPDFLRAAGWDPSDGQSGEGAAGQGSPSPADGLAEGEMPDWLKAQKPSEISSTEPSASVDGADFPAWLTDLNAAAGAASIPSGEDGGIGTLDKQPIEPLSINTPVEPEESIIPGQAAIPNDVGRDWPMDEIPTGQDSTIPPSESEATPVPDILAGLQAEPELPSPAAGESGDARPLNIEDDTMAWLENLAAKQGANAEELLTKPEDRSDNLPDWLTNSPPGQSTSSEQPLVSEPMQEQAAESLQPLPMEQAEDLPVLPEASTDIRAEFPLDAAPLDEASFDSLPAESPEPGTARPLGIEDDTMSWLEGLAARQGAKPEELLTKPDERSDIMPDWLQKTTQGAEASPEKTSPELVHPQEPIVAEVETPLESLLDEKPPVSGQEDVTITTWLKSLGDPALPADIPAAPAESNPSPEMQDDVPDWLKGIDEQTSIPASVTPGNTPGEMAGATDWMLQPEESVPDQSIPEPKPAGDGLPDWVRDEAKLAEPAAPTAPEEWIPMGQADPASKPIAEPPPVQEKVETPVSSADQTFILKDSAPLSLEPQQDKDVAILSSAQAAIHASHLDEAIKEYAKLIRKGRLLDEVIHDLREAIYRFPVDIIIWQTLGDAYMRANRLQDALDAYTKAEELLR